MLGSWSEHVDELLYDGERVRRRVDLEAATVVVTDDRILALTPDTDGETYRTARRPNVTRVSVETESALGQLVWGTVLSLLGIGFVLLATSVDLAGFVDDTLVDTDGPTGLADGALETVETLLTVFDLSILAAGGLLSLLAVLCFARYVRSRERRLVVRRSGREDIALPVTDADLEAGRPVALEDAIGPGPVSVESDDVATADPIGDGAGGDSTAGIGTRTDIDADADESG